MIRRPPRSTLFPTRRSSDLNLPTMPGFRRRVKRKQGHGLPCPCALHLETDRSEEHTSELQSLAYLVCRLLLEKKNILLYMRECIEAAVIVVIVLGDMIKLTR